MKNDGKISGDVSLPNVAFSSDFSQMGVGKKVLFVLASLVTVGILPLLMSSRGFFMGRLRVFNPEKNRLVSVNVSQADWSQLRELKKHEKRSLAVSAARRAAISIIRKHGYKEMAADGVKVDLDLIETDTLREMARCCLEKNAGRFNELLGKAAFMQDHLITPDFCEAYQAWERRAVLEEPVQPVEEPVQPVGEPVQSVGSGGASVKLPDVEVEIEGASQDNEAAELGAMNKSLAQEQKPGAGVVGEERAEGQKNDNGKEKAGAGALDQFKKWFTSIPEEPVQSVGSGASVKLPDVEVEIEGASQGNEAAEVGVTVST